MLPSNLFSAMDRQFNGNTALWQAKFYYSFARWSQVAGLSFTQVGDDGAPFPNSPGAATGARGDIRIGARSVDGAGGLLAFNYFPNTGDMVIDSDDTWTRPNTAYRYLRNVVMHEIGHGLGLGHVIPTNGTKLMEPYLILGYDGPQDDDVRGAQRLYGDPYERNDSRATATPVDLISSNEAVFDMASLDRVADVDWYHLVLPPGQRITITVAPVGASYSVGPQGGATTNINTRRIQDLQLELYAADGTLLARAISNGLGDSERIFDYSLPPASGVFYARVFSGSGSVDDVQRYQIAFRATTRPAGDVNGDGCVDDADLLRVLFDFGNRSSSLTWLGTLGGNWSEGWGVSDDGSVVVGWARNAAGQWRAYRWTAATGMQDLGTLGGDTSFAYSVSADGSVVVGISKNAQGDDRAFRWTATTGMQSLGTVGGRASGAWDVSADGQVVACSSFNAAGWWRACRWTPSTGMREIGTLGGNASASWDVSADGSVIVGWAQTSFGWSRAFRWSQSGGMQELGALSTWSEARRVSADGNIVVGWSPTTSEHVHAFRWSAGTGMQDLGELGGYESRAYGVSGDGAIVVGGAYDAFGVWSGFRWTPQRGMENLNTTYAALLTNGSTLRGAHYISPNGRFIVGYGYNAATRRDEAFLLDTLVLDSDVNNDSLVNDADLLLVLFNFGSGCR
jgi:probable HAF family extracellular repeat protein